MPGRPQTEQKLFNMKEIDLNGSDLNVSSVCLGTWQFNAGDAESSMNTWNGQDVETSKKIVDEALCHGVNFFDTAEAYANSEKVLGEALGRSRRNDVIIASKFGYCKPKGSTSLAYTPEEIESHLLDSLSRLDTNYLDLYQVHWPVAMSSAKEMVSELERQKSLGRIKYYGVCNFGPGNLKEVIEAGGKPITNQLPYNLLMRAIEFDIVELCRRNNISILAYSPLQQGLLTGKFRNVEDIPEGRRRTRHFNQKSTSLSRHGEDGFEKETFEAINGIGEVCKRVNVDMTDAALAWALAQEGVTNVIVGASRPDQVAANCRLPVLCRDTIEALSNVTDELKHAMGSKVDMWSAVSRIS